MTCPNDRNSAVAEKTVQDTILENRGAEIKRLMRELAERDKWLAIKEDQIHKLKNRTSKIGLELNKANQRAGTFRRETTAAQAREQAIKQVGSPEWEEHVLSTERWCSWCSLNQGMTTALDAVLDGKDNEIASLEAQLQQLVKSQHQCGHPQMCISSSDEGTNHCAWCESLAQARREGAEWMREECAEYIEAVTTDWSRISAKLDPNTDYALADAIRALPLEVNDG